jgi:hypothetical protein
LLLIYRLAVRVDGEGSPGQQEGFEGMGVLFKCRIAIGKSELRVLNHRVRHSMTAGGSVEVVSSDASGLKLAQLRQLAIERARSVRVP